jgi:hypothetical protein
MKHIYLNTQNHIEQQYKLTKSSVVIKVINKAD